jgi:hypothetical protein
MSKLSRRPKPPAFNVTPQVSLKAIMDATRILGDQWLSVWQRLYAVGLTVPGANASPFEVRRSQEHSACLEILPAGYPHYQFLYRPMDDVETVVPKAEALLEAINAGKALCHHRACCPVAVVSPCVCTISFSCKVHGAQCYGSHD